MFRLIAVVSLLLALDQAARAQTEVDPQHFWNDTLRRIALPTSNERWIDLREDAHINATSFFKEYGAALRLTANDEMRMFRVKRIRWEMCITVFNQYYKTYASPTRSILFT